MANKTMIILGAVCAVIAICAVAFLMTEDMWKVSVKESFEEGDYLVVTYEETVTADGTIREVISHPERLDIVSVNADGTYLVHIVTGTQDVQMTMTYSEICQLLIPEGDGDLATSIMDSIYEKWGHYDYDSISYKVEWEESDEGQKLILESSMKATNPDGSKSSIAEKIESSMFTK